MTRHTLSEAYAAKRREDLRVWAETQRHVAQIAAERIGSNDPIERVERVIARRMERQQ